MKQIPLLAFTLLLVSGCILSSPFVAATSPSPSATPGETSFKGWNLYTWKEQGLYYWSLIPATNAQPDLSKIRTQAKPGLSSLTQALQSLARGQEVFWNFQVALYSSLQFALPPASEQENLCLLARERSLKLQVATEMSPVATCQNN
ncbi:hypothetical protein COW36_16310 [bacterium (Candidatus Blackallbacteria) CG17_big_fil_post_rev_8_21_14_2_50_48_46]|uniref:Uncharacterized protein n=1 Tax=bacterium (Candidatus Blackallbacteria) CG17_big_fil_post_rev_8_21_14_2_50_48_46 TaxID=2014261 RepID=A0A2M7G1T0_9BACT|nr:MAG: hypothetical protein COW64_16780 [bacterium (Candidatus Blackallbacteria) CG18_big_fil_WC_8_21_14_2_50_49_26]PIW15699.1 MAG: hypothetical protein COW36_16310 [bacterium (Candidatus Blackallbacteria) CG17_big_fil_post_rev_8_21_14_2_50_48_46]PIW48704.1 MAG: hypothetical protein COW20_08490 [bacterium (Candidatus Blackallbacteria) CG13_big_fil_rev_8_21_14_2_50_49_14]